MSGWPNGLRFFFEPTCLSYVGGMTDLSTFYFYGNCGQGRNALGEQGGSTAERASRAPDRLL